MLPLIRHLDVIYAVEMGGGLLLERGFSWREHGLSQIFVKTDLVSHDFSLDNFSTEFIHLFLCEQFDGRRGGRRRGTF